MQASMETPTQALNAVEINGGKALVVDDELSNRVILRALLKKLGYTVVEAKDGAESVRRFTDERPDVVFMDVMMPGMDGYEATGRIKSLSGDRFVPIIFLTALTDEDALVKCIEAGGDDFLTKPFSHTILRSKIQAMDRIRGLHLEINNLYDRMRQEEEIAEQVFRTAVVADNVAMDVIPHRLQSADIFSGDLLLTARAPSGDLHLLLGDFTGHGLSAALGALPTAEVFRAMTAKGFSPEQILAAINRKLNNLLPTGMFLAGTFVRVPPSIDYLQVFNCGLPDSLLLDDSGGVILQRIGSSLLPLGILAEQDMARGMVHIPVEPGIRLLLASDGVTEAHDPNGELFGQQRFEDAIAASAGQDHALGCINAALDAFCGDAPQADDISLVEVPCRDDLFPKAAETSVEQPVVEPSVEQAAGDFEDQWHVVLVLRGSRLHKQDPIPLIINQVQELEGATLDNRSLFTVLTELYVNALDHGVLGLDSSLKSDPEGFGHYFAEREKRLEKLNDGEVRFSVQCEQHGSERRLRILVEDSGNGFDHARVIRKDPDEDPMRLHGRGIALLSRLCASLTYLGAGNEVEAVYLLKP